MDVDDIGVVIPLYKENPDELEELSLRQCRQVLGRYPLVFVTHQDLNVDRYRALCPKAVFRYFDREYFGSIAGYNALMLSREFYAAFQDFHYILIYQTDAYVFRDQLLEWCRQDFDYVGGLWVDLDPHGAIAAATCGNGGLSLRKISTFLEVTQENYRVKGWRDLARQYLHYRERGLVYRLWYALTFLPKLAVFVVPRALGYRNTYRFVCDEEAIGEDRIFVHKVLSHRGWRVPRLDQGWGFSWELHLEALWARYGELPFGCHAWSRERYFDEDVKSFWVRHIPFGDQGGS